MTDSFFRNKGQKSDPPQLLIILPMLFLAELNELCSFLLKTFSQKLSLTSCYQLLQLQSTQIRVSTSPDAQIRGRCRIQNTLLVAYIWYKGSYHFSAITKADLKSHMYYCVSASVSSYFSFSDVLCHREKVKNCIFLSVTFM